MAEKLKNPAIILIVLLVVSLAFAGAGFYLLSKEKSKVTELQDKLDELSTKQRITENKLEESKKKISDMEVKLADSQSQIDSLTKDLQQEKSANEEAQSKITQLSTDLEEQKNSRSDLEKKLDDAQNEVRKAQAELKDLNSQKADLEIKINELKKQAQGVELGKIVVSPEAAAAAPAPGAKKGLFNFGAKNKKPLISDKAEQVTAAKVASSDAQLEQSAMAATEGKVLVINKEYNFVVVNLGSKDGIEVGDVFSLYHNNQLVGDVKVEKVHDSMSAAGFSSADMQNKVSEGDKVVQKGK